MTSRIPTLPTGHVRRAPGRHAFTLVELLVVIGIIVLLIGILLPVLSRVRTSARVAASAQFIAELSAAIERYHEDQHAYPGPLTNDEIYTIQITSSPPAYPAAVFTGGFKYPSSAPPGFDVTTQTPAVLAKHFTMSENLVLGLLGGLRTQSVGGQVTLFYDPSAVGNGPMSLNTLGIPSKMPAFLDPKQLSWRDSSAGKTGQYADASGSADDSVIPEFVDTFPDAMPLIYLRSKVGANPQAGAGTFTDAYNPIITSDLKAAAKDTSNNAAPRAGQYDLSQFYAYTAAFTGSQPSLTADTASPPTGSSIGVGKSKTGTYTVPPAGGNLYHGLQMQTWKQPDAAPTFSKQFPYDGYAYFLSSTGSVHQKDGFILIGAGADRVYGTKDDQTNFGSIGQ